MLDSKKAQVSSHSRYVTLISHLNELQQLQKSALDLLASRLPSVSENSRKQISPTISFITGFISGVLQPNAEATLLPSSLTALRTIVSTAPPSEADALTKLVPSIIDVAQLHPEISGSLSIISSVTYVFSNYSMNQISLFIHRSLVGPRIIPHLQRIVSLCTASFSRFPGMSANSNSKYVRTRY